MPTGVLLRCPTCSGTGGCASCSPENRPTCADCGGNGKCSTCVGMGSAPWFLAPWADEEARKNAVELLRQRISHRVGLFRSRGADVIDLAGFPELSPTLPLADDLAGRLTPAERDLIAYDLYLDGVEFEESAIGQALESAPDKEISPARLADMARHGRFPEGLAALIQTDRKRHPGSTVRGIYRVLRTPEVDRHAPAVLELQHRTLHAVKMRRRNGRVDVLRYREE